MTRSRAGLVGVLALLAGSLVAYSCGGNSSTSPTPVGGGGGTGGTGTPADVTIMITGMNGANSFNPSSASVKAGQTVSWQNGDAIAHNPTGSGFDTGFIPPGGTSTPIKFSTAGTLGYHCGIHPTMTGTLVVTP